MHNENWDDLRYVLAVVDSGSVLQAAKYLGVNHATVLRRVTAFEEQHGLSLFERTPQGYRLLPDCAHILRAAQTVQAAMAEVGRLAGGGKLSLRGTVRITSTDTLCRMVLPQFVAVMQSEQSNLTTTLLSSNMHLDMSRDLANIAVRPALKLPDDMVGQTTAHLGFRAYASDRGQCNWLGLAGPLSRSVAAKWMDDHLQPAQIVTAADSFLTLQELAVLGHGIAVLPCFVGDHDVRLIRRPDAMPHLTVPLWVAAHVDTNETPQMSAVKQALMHFLSEHDSLLGA